MISFNKWDIVLVPFPFSDLRSLKRRPALIISPRDYNNGPDVLLAFITSNIQSDYRFGDYLIQEWQNAGLPKLSKIRMKISTIDKSLIFKNIGRLSQKDIDEFDKILIKFFSD
jgi:mRNA interferase MazF